MRKFASKGTALAIGSVEFLIRLMMWGLPVATFLQHGIAISAAAAGFMGLVDGNYRSGSFTSRWFVADREGLEITLGLTVQVVPWADVSAIQAWNHFNHVDFVAVHYFRAGRVVVATCGSRYAEQELRDFVRACARYVSADAPRQRITIAGLRDQSVYQPLLKRFFQDVAVTTLIGLALGVVGQAFVVGLLAAALSAGITAVRHPIRATRLVQTNGLWRAEGRDARPLRAIPRALRLWVQCLNEAASERRSELPGRLSEAAPCP